ncbi:MAG: Holliday junction branch migration protein RuvA [Patescibacteria group bacterium]|nr:Holliday junction branch migration protein RuvA [Patescibacteria group bacterium]
MIGYLNGEVKSKSETGIILLTGGVGYDVFLPTSLNASLTESEETELFIYTHVREDAFSLFGFATRDDLEFFKLLLSVSGIGPKVALAIISSSPTEKLMESISRGDPTLLSTVSGVGKKTAEKAVVELKGKLGYIGSSGTIFAGTDTEEIYEALLGLGFKKEEVADCMKKLPDDITETDDKIKELIKMLGRNTR